MAKKTTKFGTFGGVFTPSILTILGVIMYLRLPWVIGEAGLWYGLGIIAAAHVISVSTGLSISSIATDKKVGAGGPYYIVSRSLGLPIGGTLGIALFFGLSFSISLYVIGFSESFLARIGVDPSMQNIQICGTATIIALTVVALISTSFAIKTQYVILAAIVLSLISVALSPAVPPETMHLSPASESPNIALIFGIFFPAVTGFTAGVNMSGDLRDPKRSIPIGTMAAIGTGMIVYLSIAVFVAWKIPGADLIENKNILAEVARWPALVTLGIWGATLSSGLGSIMGAPRILQALSGDRVTPVWFAKGHGKDNEPRRALLVAFAIGEAGILIGELDAIAKVVSIFFIATYGFLNLSCAIESWASTDFRPEFRIPRMLSVVGALACLLIMVELDLRSTAAATVLFAVLFAYLKRRELALESGDTWEGVWSSLVRWGLEKLDASGAGPQRNWRPNVLALHWREVQDHAPLLAFGAELIRDRGVLTDVRLRQPGEAAKPDAAKPDAPKSDAKSEPEAEPEAMIAGVFTREVETADPWDAARALARFHGFAGLEPNTVLINWLEHRHDRPGFLRTLDELVALDFNLVLLARDPERGFGTRNRVDLWWTPSQGSFELSMALTRFLTLSDDWRRSKLRFLLLNDDPSRGDALFKSATRALSEARITATVKVLNNAIGNRPLYDWVRQESSDADLVVLGLPGGPLAAAPERIADLDGLCRDIGSVLVTRGSSQFPPVLQRVGPDRTSRARDGRAERSMTVEDHDAIELAPLLAPEPTELRAAARELSLAHDEIAREFHAECLAPIYTHDAALIAQLEGVIERAFDSLGKALAEPVLLRQRKALNKIQSSFLFQARRALAEFETDRLTAQVDALEHRVEGWLAQVAELEREAPRTLTATREAAALKATPDDPPSLRRAKRRLRLGHLFAGESVTYGFNAAPLYAYYLRHRSPALLEPALAQMAGHGYQALLELGRSISEARHALDEFALRLVELPSASASASGTAWTREGEAPDSATVDPRERAKRELAARIDERRELALERLDKLLARTRKHSEQSLDLLLRGSRTLAQSFADDIDRLDVQAVIRSERRVPKQAEAVTANLVDAAKAWRLNRQLILNRAALELHNAGFQQRLRAIVERTKDGAALTIQTGILSGATALRESLVRYREALTAAPSEDGAADPAATGASGEAQPKLRFSAELRSDFDDKRVVEELAREAQAASSELPDAIEVLGDDALVGLEDHPFEEAEVLTVSLRRLVDFLVGAELLDGLREHSARVALAEQRAVGVAQDVLHMVSFNLSEWESSHPEASASAAAELSLGERVGPVVDNALARLDAELDTLRGLAPGLGERIDAQLGKILDRTEAYAITGSEDSFKLYVRHEQGGALSRVGGATRWAQRLSKQAAVQLMYRWSAGVLLARRITTETQGNLVERTLGFVRANSPKPEVVDALPFYYSQPFLGQARVSLEFWVGREAELAEIGEAVRQWKQGRGGALLIVGEPHSGKTSLTRFTARRHFETRTKFNVLPPRGGSADLALFEARLAKELAPGLERPNLGPGVHESWDEILAAVPSGSVLMFHDLELWWERGPDGLAVLTKLTELIARWGDRLLFILELNVHALRFISRSLPLADSALAVVECQPFAAEQLKQVIEGRHRSTGLRFALDERDEDQLPAWQRARLFTRYFDYSGGYVGVALQAWISHIDRIDGEVLAMRAPKRASAEILDELRIEWIAVILQLVLHKRLTRARLARVSGLDQANVDRQLDALARAGLIDEDKQGAIALDRYVSHLVITNLRDRGYL